MIYVKTFLHYVCDHNSVRHFHKTPFQINSKDIREIGLRMINVNTWNKTSTGINFRNGIWYFAHIVNLNNRFSRNQKKANIIFPKIGIRKKFATYVLGLTDRRTSG